MNWHQIMETDDSFGVLGGAMTVVFMAVFLYWTWWAWAPSNRANIDAASRLPLDGGDQ